MGISGKMKMVLAAEMVYAKKSKLSPQDVVKPLIEDLRKLSSMKNEEIWTVGITKDWQLLTTVDDNYNFWFWLMKLPILLIDNFWALPEDEVEKKRMEILSSSQHWHRDTLAKVCVKYHVNADVFEWYDSAAEGNYYYGCYHTAENKAEIIERSPKDCSASTLKDLKNINISEHFMSPHHEESLAAQIETTQRACKALGGRIHKDTFWGMVK